MHEIEQEKKKRKEEEMSADEEEKKISEVKSHTDDGFLTKNILIILSYPSHNIPTLNPISNQK